MGNCKSVFGNFFTVYPYLHVWSWLHIHNDRRLARTCIVGILTGLLILLLSPSDSKGDMPTGGLRQTIGNYEVSIRTDPLQPQTGETVKILVSIAAVNGEDISGIPVDITVKDDGSVLTGLDRPVAVPYGHYTYQYKFEKSRVFGLVVDVYDIYFTGRQVSFVFPIEVKSTFFGLGGSSDMMGYIIVPLGVIIVSTILVLILRKRHKTKLKGIPPNNKR
jgi:hypothetical protein